MPNSSNPKPLRRALRPTATITSSYSIALSLPSFATTRVLTPSLFSKRRASWLVNTFTPLSRSTVSENSATSLSSRPISCGARSTWVTSLPKRAKACASSQPIGPPPNTIIRFGVSSSSAKRLHSVSEVT